MQLGRPAGVWKPLWEPWETAWGLPQRQPASRTGKPVFKLCLPCAVGTEPAIHPKTAYMGRNCLETFIRCQSSFITVKCDKNLEFIFSIFLK